jgi:GTP-binding protein LepA
MLHLEIVKARLEAEFEQDVLITTPTVNLRMVKVTGEEITLDNIEDFDVNAQKILEPIAEVRIYAPDQYTSEVFKLIQASRGVVASTDNSSNKLIITAEVPLLKLIAGFFNELKSVTSGFSSLSYSIKEYREAEFVKLDILVNKEEISAFSRLIYRDEAESEGRKVTEKLKEVIPRHQFAIPLQASVGAKILARETIPAFRKDVTAKLYGGDHTRKMKLLEKQKEGKKRMREFGSVQIPHDAFLKIATE